MLWNLHVFVKVSNPSTSWLVQDRVVEAPKKRRLVQAPQAPFKAPIHSKCCIGGFRETGLALVIVLRCDWPLCDIWFKSYEHFKIKMFLSVHTAGPWWIFQPKFYTFRVKSAPFKKAPGKKAAPWRLKVSTALFKNHFFPSIYCST